jgi:hypothetical protein
MKRQHGKSMGIGDDVATRPDSLDAPHLLGLGLVEMLAYTDVITHDLRTIRSQALTWAVMNGSTVKLPFVSKGIHYGAIRALPNARRNARNSGLLRLEIITSEKFWSFSTRWFYSHRMIQL